MTLEIEVIERLKSHWAFGAINQEEQNRASELVNYRLAKTAVGDQIVFDYEECEADNELLDRVALAYEVAAIEGLDALSRSTGGDAHLREQCTAAAYSAFDIRRLEPVPDERLERIFQILQLSALAYCGDRWSDLRRWYSEHEQDLNVPSVAGISWDHRLLYRLFDCWVRLFRKGGWSDLDRIRKIVAELREDQHTHETSELSSGNQAKDRAMALRLIALYHWAKASEVLAEYMLQGGAQSIFTQLDKHFESAIDAATASTDAQHEVILRWLHAASRIMVTNSLWWGTRAVNSRMTDFVRSLTRREHHAMFELLPPQRAALLEKGLLDQAKTAIVVDMPTSGGKTLLAQFRMIQALNQFDADGGWVAYVAPTRALAAQITRRLRRDFESINIRVEQLTGAVEVDAFEEELLEAHENPFNVLVATPEKLSLVIRNKKVRRPLALLVMDEAHNMEMESRGLRIELLLATAKRDCPQANFLLLMPYVESPETIAQWLAGDFDAGRHISFGTTAWKPNERIIGLFKAAPDDSERAGWRLEFETLSVPPKAMSLRGTHRVEGIRPIPSIARNEVVKTDGKQYGLFAQTAAMSAILSSRRASNATSIAVTSRPDWAWSMARHAAAALPGDDTPTAEIRLVQNFLRTEVSPHFELVDMLNHGVGVHHAGLSDEIRALMEWLAEEGKLRVLCATSTVSQGINFPVSSVFLSTNKVYQNNQQQEIAPREFWNLAGRAGRINHDSVGVVGLAQGNNRRELIDFISRATGSLASLLVEMLDELQAVGRLHELDRIIYAPQWEDFRCYIAHLWAEKKNLDAVLTDSEQLLRQTYGYTTLRNNAASRDKADALLEATKTYARNLADSPGIADLADATGFSPESVKKAMEGMRNIEDKLVSSDWAPDSLFGEAGKMAALYGVMLKVPQLSESLTEIAGQGTDHVRISNITKDWVNGVSLGKIAQTYFSYGTNDTQSFTHACKAIYRTIVNSGTWGISALSQFSDLDFASMSQNERRSINTLPAMIYHGVRSEAAVLMRMNSAPRSAAEKLGEMYHQDSANYDLDFSVLQARDYLKELSVSDWDKACPPDAALSGRDYQEVWKVLSGELVQ